MICRRCTRPLTAQEHAAYRDRCESCWAEAQRDLPPAVRTTARDASAVDLGGKKLGPSSYTRATH